MAQKIIRESVFPFYSHLMHEAKCRILEIEMMTDGRTKFLSPIMTPRECCYLQLRMLCEVIAISCIVAHENKPLGTGKLAELDKPKAIFRELARLNPNFYPQPVTLEILDRNGFRMQAIDNGSLTKDELQKLWSITGDWLHRGSAKRFLTLQPRANPDFSDILSWLDKIKRLLAVHRIARGDDQNYFACELSRRPPPGVPAAAGPFDGALILLEGHKSSG
jgi:hypothetical protein